MLLHRVVARIAASEKAPRDFGTGDMLHRAEIHTVQTIGDFPGLSITELARQMEVTKGAVSQMINRLEEKRLVERFHTQDNAKDVKLILTRRGEKARSGHEAAHREMRDQVLKRYGKNLKSRIALFKQVFEELDEMMVSVGKDSQ